MLVALSVCLCVCMSVYVGASACDSFSVYVCVYNTDIHSFAVLTCAQTTICRSYINPLQMLSLPHSHRLINSSSKGSLDLASGLWKHGRLRSAVRPTLNGAHAELTSLSAILNWRRGWTEMMVTAAVSIPSTSLKMGFFWHQEATIRG